jgi:hypothetical protein
MQKPLFKYSILICSLLTVFAVQALDLTPEKVNGIYQLAIPERSAAGQTQKLQVELGEMNGQQYLATQHVLAAQPRVLRC